MFDQALSSKAIDWRTLQKTFVRRWSKSWCYFHFSLFSSNDFKRFTENAWSWVDLRENETHRKRRYSDSYFSHALEVIVKSLYSSASNSRLMRWERSALKRQILYRKASIANPLDTGRKLNVHKTFRRRPLL